MKLQAVSGLGIIICAMLLFGCSSTPVREVKQDDNFGEVAPQKKDDTKSAVAEKAALSAEDIAAWKEVRKKAELYKRRTPRAFVFSRAQLKYGLERNDYIHKWIDRPLYVDPSLKQGGGGFIKIDSYKKMHAIVQLYGMDGFAFFPQTGRKQLFDLCTLPGNEMTVLPELVGGTMESKLEIAELALKNPHSFRIDGKVVFSSYGAIPLESWREFKSVLREKYGDKFIIMPSCSFFPPGFNASGPDENLTAGDIKKIQEYLRQWLRVVDGFYYNSLALRNRRYAPDRDREILLSIVKSVLSEPEFQNKFLGWGAKVGHENYELIGYSFDCTGTGMLRGTMETAIMADGDFINCIEWDEQNENTSFRPTVYNSLSTMRIMRHYTDKLKGRKISPLPADNLNIPNLILSYRKILVAGQKLEFEILNVPDSDQAGEYKIKLRLRNLEGKIVHEFPEQRLAAHKLEDSFLSVPVEKLLEHQVLTPELEVSGAQGRYLQDDGLQPIELRASWNWDFKWVKQPLRDLLKAEKASLTIEKSGQVDGLYQLKGTFAANEPLAYVEVMDNGDVIYSHQDAFNWRESATDVVVNINWQSLCYRQFALNGSIELVGATGKWSIANVQAPNVSARAQTINRADQKLLFKNSASDHNIKQVWTAIRRENVKTAFFKVDLPGVYQGEIKVEDIINREVLAFPGRQGFNLVFQRYVSQTHIPEHLNSNSANFDILVKPVNANSVLHLQAVAKSGKVYRGQPLSMRQRTGEYMPLAVYSESEEQAVKLDVDSSLITKAHYRFNPEHGSALLCAENARGLWGIAGGYMPQIVGRGSGESAYGCPIAPHEIQKLIPLPLEEQCLTAPEWVKCDDGDFALRFSEYTYVSLPQMLIPVYSSFVLSMEAYPDNNQGRQQLLNAGATAFILSLVNGMLECTYYQNQNLQIDPKKAVVMCKTGLKLPEKQWSKVKVYFDQQNLIFEVNGQKSRPFPCSGYHRYIKMYTLGGPAGGAFKGMIKNLSVEHRTSPLDIR